MAISVDGLVSGLDTAGIISKLVELEKRPVTLLENKKTDISEQRAAWQEVNSKLLAFETVVQKMNTSTEFNAMGGTFTNNNLNQDSIVNMSVSSNVASASYTFNVDRLATRQKIIADQGYSSTTEVLSISNYRITTSQGSQLFVGNKSLEDIRDEINGANLGVTATIINTAGGSTPNYRLQISGDDVGSSNSFTMSVYQYSDLLTFSTLQEAQDAQVKLDGLTITRSTNTFDDLIEGVSFELTQAGSGAITFKGDTTSIENNIKDFVDSYNDVMGYIKQQFTYDTANKTAPPLFGNSTLLSIQEAIRSKVTGPVTGLANASGWFASLSQIGIRTDNSDKLAIDSTTLTNSLRTNLTGVRNLFVPSGSGTYTFVTATGATTVGSYETQVITGSDGQPQLQVRRQGTSTWISLTRVGSNFWSGPSGTEADGMLLRASGISAGDTGTMSVVVGIAEQLAYRIGFVTEYSTEGAIYNERRHLETRSDDIDDEIGQLELRIKKKQEDLTRKYAMLEVTLSRLKSQSDYLGQQLANLPGVSRAKN